MERELNLENDHLEELRERIERLESCVFWRRSPEGFRPNREQRLFQAQKMEAVAGLAGGIAHEFNNALTGITGGIEMLQMERPDDPVVLKYSERMLSAARRMAELTNQILAYARGGKYQTRHILLKEFIEFILPMVKPTISARIRVTTALSAEDLAVEADVTQFHTIFTALIRNAAEAIDGKGDIRIKTHRKKVGAAYAESRPGLRPGRYACIVMEDSGKGMDEETCRRIFEPFFTTKLPGRGLGMAAVYGIVKSHSGWIGIESVPGKGTRVRLYLPLIRLQEEKRWNRQLRLPLEHS